MKGGLLWYGLLTYPDINFRVRQSCKSKFNVARLFDDACNVAFCDTIRNFRRSSMKMGWR